MKAECLIPKTVPRKKQRFSLESFETCRGRLDSVSSGFTLLEVMVALAILALTMSVLVKGVGDGANIQRRIEVRTLAQWVALNQLVKTQLEQSSVPVSNRSGIDEMAGRVWSWQQRVEKSSDRLVNRIVVTARQEGSDEEQARVVGYLWNRHE